MPDLWIPGAAQPSMEDFVERLHRQIERFTAGHRAEQSQVEVELAGGERLMLESISAEPGYGFVTLTVHREDDDGPEQVIVPVGAIRRIALGPAEGDRVRFGFALPDDGTKKAEPAA